jgi:hypothetical protein
VILICVGYGFAGLWPFNFLPRNHVIWLPDGKGIALERNSIIYSESPLDLRPSAGAVTIQLHLQSGRNSARNFTAILSLYDGELRESLRIGQQGSNLVLSLPAWDASGVRKPRRVGVTGCLPPGVTRFVTITSGAGGTAIYVDGALAKAYPKITLRPERLYGRLFLGCAPGVYRSWEGKLLGLSIFSPGLSALYYFNEGNGSTIRDHSGSGRPLVIPQVYRVPGKPVLLPPWERPVADVVLNIVGFVPFGFFYFLCRMKSAAPRGIRNTVITIAVAVGISTAIELLQVYLPSRSSQMTDILCNTGGALVGVLLAWIALRWTIVLNFK